MVVEIIMTAVILVSSCSIGFFFAQGISRRRKELEQFTHGFSLLETEMFFANHNLPDAFGIVAEKLSSNVAAVFKDCSVELANNSDIGFAEIFKDVINTHKPHLSLLTEDIEVLLRLGQSFGVSDIEDQKQKLAVFFKEINYITEEALLQEQKWGKICRGGGLMGGILLVLLVV